MHVRAQVRKAIIQACKDSGAVPVEDVHESRVFPLNPEGLPAITVYTEDEKDEKNRAARQQPRLQDRMIMTTVYIMVQANDDTEDALDDISVLVENKIFEDPCFGRLAVETNLMSGKKFLTNVANKDLGVLQLTFGSLVITQEGDSEKSIAT